MIDLRCGDCLEVMRTIPEKSVDLILCDLPYGTTACSWDVVIPFFEMWKEIERVRKPNCPVLLFSSQPFTTKLINSNLDNYGYELVWVKNTPTGICQAKYRPMKYHETIQVFYVVGKNTKYNPIMQPRVQPRKSSYNYKHSCGKNQHINLGKKDIMYDPDFKQPSSVLQYNTVPNRVGKMHPTQKPVELLEYLVQTYSDEGDVVLDFTMGSGSTGVACRNLNRSFIGIELDPKYYEIAEKRIKEKEMTNISTRETTKGREYIFRWNGQLFVFKTKEEAEIRLYELQNGSLF